MMQQYDYHTKTKIIVMRVMYEQKKCVYSIRESIRTQNNSVYAYHCKNVNTHEFSLIYL